MLNKIMRNTQLKKSFLFSLAIHLVFLSLISLNPPSPLEASSIKVKLIELEPNQKKSKIVPDSKSPAVKIAPKTKQLSAKNTVARVETLKRGSQDGNIEKAVNKTKKPVPSSSKTIRKTTSKKSLKKKTSPSSQPKLRLSQKDLTSKISKSQKESPSKKENLKKKEEPPSDNERQSNFSNALPFRRIRTQRGSSVYLPNIQDGQVTLLNSKADRNAVFVRRVALQVFGSLKEKNWASLNNSEIRQIRQNAKIHAVMSAQGDFISIRIEDSSGSLSFDEIAESATRFGTWDKNPPKNALASDGNIHFVFQTRTWARFVGDKRIEKRWLILGTGLL